MSGRFSWRPFVYPKCGHGAHPVLADVEESAGTLIAVGCDSCGHHWEVVRHIAEPEAASVPDRTTDRRRASSEPRE
ncbi:MAG: hypothetical protein AB7F99_08295 [Vicinamibacterales bacterium]